MDKKLFVMDYITVDCWLLFDVSFSSLKKQADTNGYQLLDKTIIKNDQEKGRFPGTTGHCLA